MWRLLKFIAGLLFSLHVIVITALNFPSGNALSDEVLAPLQSYPEKTGQWQSWDMFDTIPVDEHFDLAAFVVYPDGTEKKIGPLVPGLLPFTEDLKLTTLFYRFDPESEDMDDDAVWRTYTARLCREVRSREKTSDFTLYVDFIYQRLRGLDEIRQNGEVSERVVLTKKAACG